MTQMKSKILSSSVNLWLSVWVGLLFICQGRSLFIVENTPALPPRTITETNLQLSEVWRVSSLVVFSSGSDGSPQIALTPNQIVTINYKDGGWSSKLVSYSTVTGSVNWKTHYGGAASSLIADQNRVYVASAGRRVEAYNLQTGKLLWSGMDDLPSRQRYDLDVRDGVLFNYQKATRETEEIVYIYDINTGETLQKYTEVIDASHSALVMWLGQFALYQNLEDLFKINRETNKIMWRVPIENASGYNNAKYFGIKQFPILSDNKLLVVSGRIDLSIYALDYMTGKRLWTAKGPFTSNAAVSQGKVYALRQDARLVILDEATGTELGFVQFSPAETPAATYWVGADDHGQIYVYFSDSQELIALKIN